MVKASGTLAHIVADFLPWWVVLMSLCHFSVIFKHSSRHKTYGNGMPNKWFNWFNLIGLNISLFNMHVGQYSTSLKIVRQLVCELWDLVTLSLTFWPTSKWHCKERPVHQIFKVWTGSANGLTDRWSDECFYRDLNTVAVLTYRECVTVSDSDCGWKTHFTVGTTRPRWNVTALR